MKIRDLPILIIVVWTLCSTAYVQAITEPDESKELEVTCQNKIDKRVLNYYPLTNLWCDATLDDFCEPQRLEAAQQVCSERYALVLKDLSSEPKHSVSTIVTKNKVAGFGERSVPTRFQLESELLDIREQLLDIKVKRMELEKKIMKLKMGG